MPKKPTANVGAGWDRACTKKKIKRMMKSAHSNLIDGEVLCDWIDSRRWRTGRKKGGLGRK